MSTGKICFVMGQPISVIQHATSDPAVIRFDTNRVLTGTGHEVYLPHLSIGGRRPADVLARRLFERGGIRSVHVNGSIVTVGLETGTDEGIKEIIEGLYQFYQPGVSAVEAQPEG